MNQYDGDKKDVETVGEVVGKLETVGEVVNSSARDVGHSCYAKPP